MAESQVTSSPWFAVRSLFYDDELKAYEERTVLFKATSEDEAFTKAEEDAKTYASQVNSVYVGYSDLFHLIDEELGEAAEIFSLMRTPSIDAETYISRFLDTGTERRHKLIEHKNEIIR
jgi:hypothetical protein